MQKKKLRICLATLKEAATETVFKKSQTFKLENLAIMVSLADR